ncbi:aminopeptidase [Pseudozyma hubeiensis SY62]|uniref:Aminopeptidase n=1 Tax=Pseudozyma hubeiensis (strain SY62) TaxID=1305764 RepID=R9P7Y7_PSEHS|nr:aminopeptidase [Pseudozyma hubeiensis SY62]GAC97518.1 aminopeptidase [Pseudozyma hubeiensis SY62]
MSSSRSRSQSPFSSAPKNPSLLSIPPTTPASVSDQSPTTPKTATVNDSNRYHFPSGQASSVDAALRTEEQALHQLTADDVHNPQSTAMGNVSEQSAMDQILSGVLAMQKELSRLNLRMEEMENKNEATARRNSFYGAFASGQMSPALKSPGLMPGLMRRSTSPPKNHGAMDMLHAPHLSMGSSAYAQPAPLLAEEPKLGLWAVVPAGGAGTRLWPLSRESYPKFLLDLTGSGRTLLQSTWDRLLPLAGQSQMMIVTGQAHVGGVTAQLPELEQANVLAEPSPKESMAAIGLAAAVLLQRDPEAVLGSFAADHIISGRDAFESAVTEAVATAKAGYLVTIGIAPSHPSTGFGYIKLGEKLSVSDAPNARRVTEFKEKPDARTAAAYLSTGDYRWNGGMFVVKAQVLLDLLKDSNPELHEGLLRIAAAWDSDARDSVMSEVWPTLPKIAIDHAVAEPASKVGKVAVVPATFGWDDVGDFASLADLIPAEEGEPRILGDTRLVVTESQAGGLIIPAAGRPIACLGVDDVVVVDTPDALLITTRARSQDVKKIVGRTKKVYPELC